MRSAHDGDLGWSGEPDTAQILEKTDFKQKNVFMSNLSDEKLNLC